MYVYIYISWCARDAAISVIYLCIDLCRYEYIVSIDRPMCLYIVCIYIHIYHGPPETQPYSIYGCVCVTTKCGAA